jgi:muramoyltetrapeptide carboxypeptidase
MIHSNALPPVVHAGDRVGVAALSGAVDPARLARGLEALAGLGFVPVEAPNLRSRHRVGDMTLAGSDSERLDAFHELLADDSLGAIFFARGGHGLLRILDGLDWERIGRRPRAFVGYSDLTPLLLGIVQRFGWVAFHGPMVAADLARGLSEVERDSLLQALAGTPGPWPLAAADEDLEGVLLGGCLSLLNALAGTPFLPDLRGSLLFWEDLNEPLYRIDRMLRHLRLSGSLNGVGGMIIGHLDSPDGSRGPDAEALRSACAPTTPQPALPLAFGLPAGHVAPNLTLALGARAAVDGRGLELRCL